MSSVLISTNQFGALGHTNKRYNLQEQANIADFG